MSHSDDRFGMPDSAFLAAMEAHGTDNPAFRSGMYVPTRREVAEQPTGWLSPVLIDWMWESPSELTPNNDQISQVRAILSSRSDAGSEAIRELVTECDKFLAA